MTDFNKTYRQLIDEMMLEIERRLDASTWDPVNQCEVPPPYQPKARRDDLEPGKLLQINPHSEIALGPSEECSLHIDDGCEWKPYTPFYIEPVSCNHTWKRYTGIFESYMFCIKCDQKENK